MKKFLCKNPQGTHTVEIDDEDIKHILPVEDQATARLAVGESYSNPRAERTITRIA